MGEFILGTNYWASHAGTDMWKDWQVEVVEKDLSVLRCHGIKYLRVFPNWRDFQPVVPAYGGGHSLKELPMEGDARPENPFYLSEKMLERFHTFCGIAEKEGLKLIVGLITGWMSGRLFVPPALYEKNLYTDPLALYLQQLYIKGFVTSMKEEKSICAWDLGNECNCMDKAEKREEACCWTSVIVNAVKASDPGRPVISGMHSLELSGIWNIQDQGEMTDMLTTHPYPYWVEHCHRAPITDFRVLLHGTAQTQYYAGIGKKPCLVEEIGTMGPMVCDEEREAKFFKVNLWSNWANGAAGVMWWCAHDQSLLTAPPYDWNMCERELGMLDVSMNPKGVLRELDLFQKSLAELSLELPRRKADGVCILSQGQDHWGIAYMAYLLGKQAGLTLDFAWCEQELPDSGFYFLPSVCMPAMSKRSYDRLKEKVSQGTVLYISSDDGFFTEFETFAGLRVEEASQAASEGEACWDGRKLPYSRTYTRKLSLSGAEQIFSDESGRPLFTVNRYGKGKVYYLNFPLEKALLEEEDGFEKEYYRIYQKAAEDLLRGRGIQKENPWVGMTVHSGEKEDFIVLINYTSEEQKPGLKTAGIPGAVLYGDPERLEPFGAAVMKLPRK